MDLYGLGGKNMNTKCKNKVVNLKKTVAVLVTITISVSAMPGFIAKAHSFDQSAFVGGMLAGHVLGGAIRRSKMRTAAEMHQAYGKPSTAYRAAPAPAHAPTTAPTPAPAAKPTVEQRLQELDKLAAGGYITPEDYKAKKKAILDSL
jgi:hypothetical protein